VLFFGCAPSTCRAVQPVSNVECRITAATPGECETCHGREGGQEWEGSVDCRSWNLSGVRRESPGSIQPSGSPMPESPAGPSGVFWDRPPQSSQ
jgi:hypothetical protein